MDTGYSALIANTICPAQHIMVRDAPIAGPVEGNPWCVRYNYGEKTSSKSSWDEQLLVSGETLTLTLIIADEFCH